MGINTNGFISKPITATLGTVKLIKGTNRDNITTVSAGSSQWVGRYNAYQTLEIAISLDAPCNEIDVSINTKYYNVQAVDTYYWYAVASPTTLSSFPLGTAGGEPFCVTDTSTDVKTVNLHLYANLKRGTNYIYIGLNASKNVNYNRLYVYANTLTVSGMSSRKTISANTIFTKNIFRYSQDYASSYWWKTVEEYGKNFAVYGANHLDRNYHHAVAIPLPAFDVAGRRLRLRWFGYTPENHLFRWQLCTSLANKTSYENTKSAVTDSTAIAGGTFSNSGSGNHVMMISLDAEVPSGTPLYLYIWAYEQGQKADHIMDRWDVLAIVD